jgi:tetratricopeptide (TPR) repeat protein
MSREARTALLVAALLVVPAAGIARLQPRLAKTVHDVKQRDDIYVLPPPAELRVLTLGYYSATVDLLWGKLLVEYGTHWHEKREFDATHYLDAILELEPDYAPVYKFADTLLVYKPPRGYEADARKARLYLERGTRERPGDFEVWEEYGQFMAFIGPAFLPQGEEREQWRREGAHALAHSVELGAHAERTLAAASILSRAGETKAVLKYLSRAYALAEDPQTRDEIAMKMRILKDTSDEDESQRAIRFIEARWHSEYPFLKRDEFLLMGPSFDATRCAGPASADDPRRCARDWDDLLGSEGL